MRPSAAAVPPGRCWTPPPEGYGGRGAEFLRSLFSRYARQSARATELLVPGQLQRECWERLSVGLHKALARQLVRFVTRSRDTPLEEGDGAGAAGSAAVGS